MITIDEVSESSLDIRFVRAHSEKWELLSEEVKLIFDGSYLSTCMIVERKTLHMLVGTGEKMDRHGIQEACAKATKELKKKQIASVGIQVGSMVKTFGVSILREVILGSILGFYQTSKESYRECPPIYLRGIGDNKLAQAYVDEMYHVVKGVLFARDMVNLPGNCLRPLDFSKRIVNLMEGTSVVSQQLVSSQIKASGMNGLATIGLSSEYPPCFLILRYMGNPDSKEITGFVGKGVTYDTGGYCLKSADGMKGAKGDMAGGAAVAGAIYALASNQVKCNVVGLIPMCENRISKGGLLPGDVITMLSKKTVEVVNTDAEGRLILADGVTYALQSEQVTRVLDIATLTGAVVGTLGFGTAGVMSDNKEFYEDFKRASKVSNEKYWRFPYEKEHEKLIESDVADLKNMGATYAQVITAGLFIRAFAESKPWIHVDIAGTAWVDTPLYEYQSKGATGAGVTTLYHLCKKEEA